MRRGRGGPGRGRSQDRGLQFILTIFLPRGPVDGAEGRGRCQESDPVGRRRGGCEDGKGADWPRGRQLAGTGRKQDCEPNGKHPSGLRWAGGWSASSQSLPASAEATPALSRAPF